MRDKKYNSMPLLYTFETETTELITAKLAGDLQKRRLEKGLSREALSMMSGVPTPTIAKFERQHTVSLTSFVALAMALGYTKELKAVMDEPLYDTMDELLTINRNKNRKRGRNDFNK